MTELAMSDQKCQGKDKNCQLKQLNKDTAANLLLLPRYPHVLDFRTAQTGIVTVLSFVIV